MEEQARGAATSSPSSRAGLTQTGGAKGHGEGAGFAPLSLAKKAAVNDSGGVFSAGFV